MVVGPPRYLDIFFVLVFVFVFSFFLFYFFIEHMFVFYFFSFFFIFFIPIPSISYISLLVKSEWCDICHIKFRALKNPHPFA